MDNFNDTSEELLRFFEEYKNSLFTYDHPEKIALISMYVIIFVLALVGNFLILLMVCLKRSTRKNITNFFLVNLAVADLLGKYFIDFKNLFSVIKTCMDWYITQYIIVINGPQSLRLMSINYIWILGFYLIKRYLWMSDQNTIIDDCSFSVPSIRLTWLKFPRTKIGSYWSLCGFDIFYRMILLILTVRWLLLDLVGFP